jgi:hypothetical protein
LRIEVNGQQLQRASRADTGDTETVDRNGASGVVGGHCCRIDTT